MIPIGTRGPIPNRDADLARPRERKGNDTPAATKGLLRSVAVPDPDPRWHAIVRGAWDALSTSGMADFYQNTDWAYAYIVLEELNAYLLPGIDKAASREATAREGVDTIVRYPERRLSGMTFTSIMSALQSLGMTEGDRRRMRIELETPAEPERSAQLIAINGYLGQLGQKDPTDD